MCVDSITKAHESIIAHKANIRGGGKTVHVVFKYLSRRLLAVAKDRGRRSKPHRWASFFRKVTVSLHRLVKILLAYLIKFRNEVHPSSLVS
jgi:hypothetical protein